MLPLARNDSGDYTSSDVGNPWLVAITPAYQNMPCLTGTGHFTPVLAAYDSISDAPTSRTTKYIVGGLHACEEPTASNQFRERVG